MTAVLPRDLSEPSLAELARRQCAIVARAQLVAHGVPEFRVRRQLVARRWQEVGPLVIALHNGPLTQEQQEWAVLLNAGPDAALCGRTGAAVDGLRDCQDGLIHVIVQHGCRPPHLPSIAMKVHESKRYEPDRDIRPNRSPPRLRLERNLIDAAAWTKHPRVACGLLIAAIQQRLTTAARLLDTLGTVGLVRHRRVLRLALRDVAGGAMAMSEIDFVRFCRARGLAPPLQQQVRLDPFGRRRYVDASFVRPDGSRFGVEIDGAIHLIVGTYWADCDRSNELVIAGESLLRFPSIALYLSPDLVADQLCRMLIR